MKLYKDIIQNTPEWYAIRAGKITGSVVGDLITGKGLKLSESATAKGIYSRVAYEMKNDVSLSQIFESYESWEMKQGKIYEAEAREYFTANDFGWQEVGFVDSEILFGISPDCMQFGFSGEIITGLEIKCPQSVNGYLELNGIKNGKELQSRKFDYYAQVQLCMYVCGCDTWQFISYVNEEKRKQGAKCTEFEAEKDEKLFSLFHEIGQYFVDNYSLIGG